MTHVLQQPCDEVPARAAPATAICPERSKPWVLVATILGSSMAFIDGTVVNVALARIQGDFRATFGDAQWVVEAYALTLAALLLPGGALGDQFGRRRVFTAGVLLFTAASAACGLAPNIGTLILARAGQGIGGALLIPNSLAILSAAFPDEERGRAIGTWSAFTGITSAVGPVLGGWLVETGSWRWVFFLNVPIAAVVLAVTLRHVPETRAGGAARRVDLPGAALATLGLGLLVYGLIELPERGWKDGRVVWTVVGGLAALVAFLQVERRRSDAMMPLDLFRSRTFAGANLLTFFLYAALGGAMFFLPYHLLQAQGYTATAAGAALLPLILILFLLSRWAGGLVARSGARLPLTLGPIVAGLGFALLARPGLGGSYWATFFPGVAVLGLGMAISVAPLTTTVMGAWGEERAGIASGVNNAVSRIAALVAIAVFGIVVAGAFQRSLELRLADLPLSPGTRRAIEAQRGKLTEVRLPEDLQPQAAEAVRREVRVAFVDGFRAAMWTAAGLAVAGAAASAWLIRTRPAAQRRGGSPIR